MAGQAIQQNAVPSDALCPVCACSMSDGSELHVCSICLTPHHKDCWEYTGGCAIFGCRKGHIKKYEGNELEIVSGHSPAVTPVDLGLMWIWGKVLSAQWIACLLAHYGVVAFGLGFALSFTFGIMTYAFPLLASLIFSVVSLSTLMHSLVLVACTIFAGVFGYVASLVPDFALRAYFGITNPAAAHSKMETAKLMASRIDLSPALVSFSTGLCRIARGLSYACLLLSSIVLSGVILGFSAVSVELSALIALSIAPIVSLIILAMLPMINGDMNSRLSFISTMQNRLIASAKESRR